jgi:hypothetical protein
VAGERIDAWSVLGRHRAAGLRDHEGRWFDGIDLVLHRDDGTERLVGFRTGELFLSGAEQRDSGWEQDYRPIPADLDPATVRHWDFGQILWLGPSLFPCLVWTNAEAFRLDGVSTMFRVGRVEALLAGANGRGLPTPADLAAIWSRPQPIELRDDQQPS